MPKPRKFPAVLSNKYGRVAVYRVNNKNYTTYRVVWNEGRLRRMEGRNKEAEAMRRAEEILADISNGIAPRKDATAEKWGYYQRCEEMLGGVPLIKAVEYFLEHGVGKDAAEEISMGAAVERYIAAKKSANKSARYLETLSHHLRPLEKVFIKPLSMISVSDLDAYLCRIPNTRTRGNHRRSILTLWRWAQSKGLLPRGKETAADLTDAPVAASKDPEIITPDELQAVLTAAEDHKGGPHHLIPYLAIAAFAGVRSAEICRMTWEDHINLESGTIVLGSDITKKRRRRVIKMEPCLHAWLSQHPNKGPVVKVASVHQALRKLRNVKWPHNALRHSAVSYLMATHRNAALVAEQCGHTESELQASYKALTSTEAASKWFNCSPKSKQTNNG